MTSTPTLYYRSNCIKAKTILTLNQFVNTKLDVIEISKLSKEDQTKLFERSPTGTFPLLRVGDFFLSGTRAILKYIIGLSDQNELDFLHPKNHFEASHIEMWVDYTINNVWVLLENLLIESDGNLILTTDELIKKEAQSELTLVLNRLNSTLQFKTFLVSNNLTLADLVLAASLFSVYKLVLDAENVKTFNHLTRWFKFASNLKQFKGVFGEAVIQS